MAFEARVNDDQIARQAAMARAVAGGKGTDGKARDELVAFINAAKKAKASGKKVESPFKAKSSGKVAEDDDLPCLGNRGIEIAYACRQAVEEGKGKEGIRATARAMVEVAFDEFWQGYKFGLKGNMATKGKAPKFVGQGARAKARAWQDGVDCGIDLAYTVKRLAVEDAVADMDAVAEEGKRLEASGKRQVKAPDIAVDGNGGQIEFNEWQAAKANAWDAFAEVEDAVDGNGNAVAAACLAMVAACHEVEDSLDGADLPGERASAVEGALRQRLASCLYGGSDWGAMATAIFELRTVHDDSIDVGQFIESLPGVAKRAMQGKALAEIGFGAWGDEPGNAALAGAYGLGKAIGRLMTDEQKGAAQ